MRRVSVLRGLLLATLTMGLWVAAGAQEVTTPVASLARQPALTEFVREMTGADLGVYFMDWAVHADHFAQFTVPGFEYPRRTLSTPAMNVVATAPSPGVSMPSLPVAGAGGVRASAEDAKSLNSIRQDCDSWGSCGIAQRELIAHWETLRALGTRPESRSTTVQAETGQSSE